MGQRGYLTLWPPTELSALRALGVLSLAVQMLPDLRDHHGPFADGQATRLTEPARTSPTAKTPGSEVA